MHLALNVLGLVVVVGFVAGASKRFGVSEPLALVVVGTGLSFVPGVLEIHLTPDLVLFGLLPPLLYAAAIRTSLVDFRRNSRAILLLSVDLVIVTTALVGLVSWWLIPGLPWPPPSRSARWWPRRTPWPPPPWPAGSACRARIVSILEGESLLNDATALVVLTPRSPRSRIDRPVAGGWDFVRAAGGGMVIGLRGRRSCWPGSAGTSTTRCSTPRCLSPRPTWPSCPPRRSTPPACSPSSWPA